MIGGFDTIIPCDNTKAVMDKVTAFVDWKDAVIEEDGKDIFYYESQHAFECWEKDVQENTMIYFILDEKLLTIVTDEEITLKIRSFLDKEMP